MKTRTEQIQLAHQYLSESSKLQFQAKYVEGMELSQKATAIFLQYQQWKDYVLTIVDIGGIEIKLTHTKEALKSYQKALETAKNQLPPKHEAFRDVYNGFGNYYCYLNNYQKGLEYYEKALEVSEYCQKKDFDHLRIYANIGTCWGFAGQYSKQLENLYNALQFIEDYLSTEERKTLKVQQAIAQLYNNIAWVHGELGDFQQNLAYHKKALALRKSLFKENHPDIAASYSNIGGSYTLINDFEKQVLYFQRALHIYQKIFGDKHYDVGRMYNNLGGAYESIEDYDQQLFYYLKSLEIHLHLYGEEHPFVARCYSNIGYNYIYKKDYPTALQNLLKAKEIRSKLLGAEHFEMANIYEKLGKCYDGLQNRRKGKECYEQAIQIKQKAVGSQHPILAESYTLLGNHYLYQDKFSKAILFFQKAIDNSTTYSKNKNSSLNTFQQHRFSRLFLKTISQKGKAHYLRHIYMNTGIEDLKEAIETFKTAIQLLDYIRTNFQIEFSKLVLSKSATEICEYALKAALKLWEQTHDKHYIEVCFYFSEKNRAMVLLEALKDTEAKLTANIPTDLLEEEKEIRTALTFVEKKLQQLQSRTKPNPTAILQLQEQRFKHHQKYEALLEKYETTYPAYFQLKYSAKTSSIEVIQQHLSPQNTLIEYFIGEEQIYIFYLQKEDFGLQMMDKPNNFKDLIEQLHHSIAWTDEELLIESATNLYQLLLQPIEKQLRNQTQLIIIRDENLHLLPFDLLIPSSKTPQAYSDFNQLPYLIHQYEILYHYSATTWLYCLQKQMESPTQSDSFLGIAPVNFHKNSGIELAMTTHRGNSEVVRSNEEGVVALQQLPNTAIEVKEVYNLFHDKKLDAKAFLYGTASKQTLIEEAPKFKYLLISTHGFAHNEHNNLSGIYLSNLPSIEPSDSSHHEENILTISEAYNLELSADLVVLSSCGSGVGTLQQGEGIMAINRGFLYAGANNIIFTQFDIPDEASSQLVKRLFEGVLAGKSYAAALREAKLSLLKEEHSSPQDWAGFSLIGQ